MSSSLTVRGSGLFFRALASALLCIGLVGAAFAQTPVAQDDSGFKPNRDYLSLLPFEAIDTASGNVMLTFTDLALPGNGGRTLAFTRVFNSAISLRSKWRFGVAGVPMRLIEKALPPNGFQFNSVTSENLVAPEFELVDGSNLTSTFVSVPKTNNASSLRWVHTSSFWRYDRTDQKLYLPDGLVAHYDGAPGALSRRLDSLTDPFGNVVSLSYQVQGGAQPTIVTVTQNLGNGDSRVIQIALNEATQLPLSMTYDGRTWNYVPESGLPYSPFARVESPDGRAWRYAYDSSTGRITQVQAPQGGSVTYEWGTHNFQVPGTETMVPRLVLDHRTTGGREIEPGTWHFSYVAYSVTVTLPSLTTIEYGYDPSTASSFLGTGWMLVSRKTRAQGATEPIETASFYYQLVSNGRTAPSYEIVKTEVLRDNRLTRTTYTYRTADHGDYHHPSQILEEGDFTRTTTFTYTHVATAAPGQTAPRWFLALPGTKATTVTGADTVQESWVHELTTGFRTSQTIAGISTAFVASAQGNVATVTRGNGKQTTYTYRYGQVSRISTPGTTTTRDINTDGSVASETVGERATTFSYDPPSRRLKTVQPPGTGVTPVVYTYDDVAMSVSRQQGPDVSTTWVDGFGRTVRTEAASGARTVTDYDAQGLVTYQSNPFLAAFPGPSNFGTSTSYDALGRRKIQTLADGNEVEWSYNTNTVTVHDELARPTVYTYKAFGSPDDARLTGVLDAENGQWIYAYTTAGRLKSVTGPGNVTRTWQFDARGLTTQESHPEAGTILYTIYDGAGVLKEKKDPRGTTFTYGHDGDDRLTSITAGGEQTAFGYEPGTNLRVSMTESGGASTVLAYDDSGRVRTRADIVDGKVFSTTFDFDGRDNLIQVTYPSGRKIGYDYDAAGRIARVFNAYDGATLASNFAYAAHGGLSHYDNINATSLSVAYDPNRQWVTGISSGPLLASYARDAVGNVLHITEAQAANNQTFTYDWLDRVKTAQSAYGPMQFDYDGHGNRTSANGSTYAYQPGTFRLTGFNGQSLGYDLNGNLKTGPVATFEYSLKNQMVSSSVAGADVAFAYDADSMRVKKATAAGVTTYYVRGPGGQLLSEWTNTTPAARVRDFLYADDRLLAVFDVTQPPR